MNELLFFSQILLVCIVVVVSYRMKMLQSCLVLCVVLANLFALKQIEIFGIVTIPSNPIYMGIFFASNLLVEDYSKKEAKMATWYGFFATFMTAVFGLLIVGYTPIAADFAHEAYQTLFEFVPRVTLAGIVAYALSSLLNIYCFDVLKSLWKQKMLWLRNILTLFISQTFDTILFTYLAFYGVIDDLWSIILFSILTKIGVAIVGTPFLTFVRKYNKHT